MSEIEKSELDRAIEYFETKFMEESFEAEKHNEFALFVLKQVRDGKLVEVVRGKWAIVTSYATKTKYICTKCCRTIIANSKNPQEKFPYCHCGAKMGKEQTNEND